MQSSKLYLSPFRSGLQLILLFSFATIDYMIHAYGPYSASATGGNGFARDFLAGIATFYATPCKRSCCHRTPLSEADEDSFASVSQPW